MGLQVGEGIAVVMGEAVIYKYMYLHEVHVFVGRCDIGGCTCRGSAHTWRGHVSVRELCVRRIWDIDAGCGMWDAGCGMRDEGRAERAGKSRGPWHTQRG